MGLLDSLFGRSPVVAHALDASTRTRFAIDADSIPAQIFGLESYADPVAPAPRIDRRSAIQLPAIKRCRDLIAGSIGGLPLNVIDTDHITLISDLLDQPERDVPRSVTMTRTVEDMLLEGRAWWRVTQRDMGGWPTQVRRLHPRSVTIEKDQKVYYRRDGVAQGTAMEWIPDADLIRFESPNDALLEAGARAIRTCLRLDAAAARSAESPMPQGIFTPVEGADPISEDPLDADAEIQKMLAAWKLARQTNADAYVPAAMKYNPLSWNPKDLQLAEARQHAVLEIARVAGVDPEELGVSTTSRTYSNQFDRRKNFLDFTLGAYIDAIQDRLSMRDVTRKGYYVRFNLDAFLRSSTKERYEAYQIGLDVGAVTRTEIREAEDRPALTEADMPKTQPAPQLSQFDGDQVAFTAPPAVAAFSVDMDKRTITGLVVPFGKVGKSAGKDWSFGPDSLTWSDPTRVKLLLDHDFKQAVGYAVTLDKRADGIYGTFKVARGDAGDRALILAEDRVYDGLSVGVGHGGRLSERDGIFSYSGAPVIETSLTPLPAFADARVHAVAASKEGTEMTETKVTPEAEVPAEIVFSAEQYNALLALVAKPDAPKVADGPQVISAAEGGSFSVKEEAPYRFDGLPGAHDFSSDLFAGARGDSEAMQRATTFTREAFAPQAAVFVTSANVTPLNPPRQRPDMYVDQKPLTTPFYDALYKGTLADQTPFVFPRFTSASGLVADHVEGVEPVPGSFVAGSQTVTPSALSGKVEISREIFNAGGSPQVSGLIWNKMVRAYYDALETKAVGVLNAATPDAITLTTAAADDALVNELEAAIAALQFVRGGNRFNYAGTQIDLYLKLAAAVDSTGRKLLPMYGPTNANGQARNRFSSLDVAGVEFAPAPSLAATGIVPASSYLVDTADVHVWNTAPTRLEFQYRVAFVDLAIWGFVAAAISDLTGVRELIYDPSAL